MAANSEIKHKSETMREVIRGLVPDFVIYFVKKKKKILYI